MLMVDNPQAPADAVMVAKLASLGVTPGQIPRWGLTDRWAIGLGRWLADRTVARELGKRPTVRGWLTPPAILGNYGDAYNVRAVVAMIGLGANLPADSIYPSAAVDGDGAVLHGDHRYRMHFAKGMLPPVRAFWSVTAYGADDFFIDNHLGRYALGDRDPLVVNADGSLDLLVQAAPPDAAHATNWLPVRAGEPFMLNARLYWPKAAALDGSWSMPAIEPMDSGLFTLRGRDALRIKTALLKARNAAEVGPRQGFATRRKAVLSATRGEPGQNRQVAPSVALRPGSATPVRSAYRTTQSARDFYAKSSNCGRRAAPRGFMVRYHALRHTHEGLALGGREGLQDAQLHTFDGRQQCRQQFLALSRQPQQPRAPIGTSTRSSICAPSSRRSTPA